MSILYIFQPNEESTLMNNDTLTATWNTYTTAHEALITAESDISTTILERTILNAYTEQAWTAYEQAICNVLGPPIG